jgi:heme oxygenase
MLMRSTKALRDRLRECTRQDHLQIDNLLATLDLASTADYVRFLEIHAEALSQLTNQIPSGDRADARALLTCLHSDLAYYGAARTLEPAPSPGSSFARQLGVAYVIRGSRLGAQVLMRRVPAAAPCAYLACRPSIPWPGFLLALESFSQEHPAEEQAVIEGATAAFGVFLAVARSLARHGL